MRYSNFIFLCLLATLLYFVFQFTTSPTSAPATSSSARPARPSMRSLSSLSPSKLLHLNEVDVEAKKLTNQKDTSMAEENADSNSDAELVYNIDYNGVTTHPTPTPKHP